ncbi:phosphate/phosphite/phosphonate ABC transporter substrate-binding protein [Duganella callida]|uniref:Phosphate ABC transporter substrate-binding protein n=1 Tax=Duganella callida TaxID=2561932 RepID=A0A4Y9S6K7_9BURK|nr:PhnD/SsuA/transferrin family substrate-binding protein [Duganella callida]TFW15688.1 phosphate ABC transporter substrate-binding protein [Duganella callida]
MNWKISLPMYNVSPRVQREYEAFAACLLRDAGIDAALVPAPDLFTFWRQPDMLLSQTCGYPYMKALRDSATLLATPCFDFPGCDGADYSSVIVAREGSGIGALADARGGTAAANEPHSNSGMNALRHAVAPLARAGRFFGEVKWSGSHAASLRMVQAGEADIAAIDCVTFAYLTVQRPETVRGIRVLRHSASSPGLPLITGRAVPPPVHARLLHALLAPGPELRAHMRILHIKAFRTDADYQRIARLEADAVAAGYPVLG